MVVSRVPEVGHPVVSRLANLQEEYERMREAVLDEARQELLKAIPPKGTVIVSYREATRRVNEIAGITISQQTIVNWDTAKLFSPVQRAERRGQKSLVDLHDVLTIVARHAGQFRHGARTDLRLKATEQDETKISA
jgi:hypothetical protein